jgi:hypothetical protein
MDYVLWDLYPSSLYLDCLVELRCMSSSMHLPSYYQSPSEEKSWKVGWNTKKTYYTRSWNNASSNNYITTQLYLCFRLILISVLRRAQYRKWIRAIVGHKYESHIRVVLQLQQCAEEISLLLQNAAQNVRKWNWLASQERV